MESLLLQYKNLYVCVIHYYECINHAHLIIDAYEKLI